MPVCAALGCCHKSGRAEVSVRRDSTSMRTFSATPNTARSSSLSEDAPLVLPSVTRLLAWVDSDARVAIVGAMLNSLPALEVAGDAMPAARVACTDVGLDQPDELCEAVDRVGLAG